MTDQEMLDALQALATKTAKRDEFTVSIGYDVARDIWGLWWKLKREVDAKAEKAAAEAKEAVRSPYLTCPDSSTHCMRCGSTKG